VGLFSFASCESGRMKQKTEFENKSCASFCQKHDSEYLILNQDEHQCYCKNGTAGYMDEAELFQELDREGKE
jgi:hypothetical protein